MLWLHVINNVYAVTRGELPEPKITSFREKACQDPLFPVKTLIFQSMAKQVAPFLVQHQTDKHVMMLPFMTEDMYKLIKGNFCTRARVCVSIYTYYIYIQITFHVTVVKMIW